MGRPRGSKNKVSAEESLTTSEAISGAAFTEVHWEPVIRTLTVDFGREDLNNLGNKLNEVIEYINNHAV